MRKQLKALIWASSVTAVAATGIFLGTHFYGKTDAAKGTKIAFNNDSKADFTKFTMNIIDESTGQEKIVGTYDPIKNTINGKATDEYLKEYRQNHGSADPIFRIQKGFFKLNNKYIDSVSIEDWTQFALWYLGDGSAQYPGHLAYGPESGSISTFEIVPGVSEMAGGGVVLGGRDSSNNEFDKITFYPDSFFGTFALYDMEGNNYFNRLLEPMFPSGEKDANGNAMAMEFTYEEAQEAIKLVNKINKFNGKYISTSSNLDPQVLSYWNNPKWGAKSFTFNGSNAPAPYTIQKSSIKTVDGKSVQYYSIYSELFTRKDGANGGDSLLRKVAKAFPSVLQSVDSPYVDYNKATGEYTLKTGVHEEIPFGKRIGLPYILKATQPDTFKGFGIDFLKYVAIHEYGHHLTLVPAQDASEGGVTMGAWNGRSAPSATNLYNIDELNRYLSARSSGIRAIKTDPYNKPIDGWRLFIKEFNGEAITDDAEKVTLAAYKKYVTSYYAFAIPTAAVNSEKPLVIDGFRFESLGDVSSDQTYSRAFRLSMRDLADKYVEAAKTGNDKLQTSVYNALLQNAFDSTSGTLNPSAETGPFRFAETRHLTNDGDVLLTNMKSIWALIQRDFSDYEKNIVKNILFSTIRGMDASKWPASERQNLQTYLNFLYKQGEDYSEPVAEQPQMMDKFLRFYTDPKFLDAWFAKGAVREDYLKAVKGPDTSKGQLNLNEKGFDKSLQYAYANGRQEIDGELTRSFFNARQGGWTTFNQVILNWQDGSNTHKLFSETSKGTNDGDDEFIYVSDQQFKTWNPYAGFDPAQKRDFNIKLYLAENVEDYRDVNGKSIQLANGKYISDVVADASVSDADKTAAKKEARAILREKLIHILNTEVSIIWSISSAKPDSSGLVPFKSDVDGIFSDYVYTYAEVMTRDYVQMVFAETGKEQLRNVDPMLGVSPADTTFEYYIHGDLSKMYATHDENGQILSENFITDTDAALWARPIAEAIRLGDQKSIDAILTDPADKLDAAGFDKMLIEKMDGVSANSGFLAPAYGIEPFNEVFGHDKFLSNGFETDHSLRTLANWQLYNDADGTPRLIKPEDNIHIKGPDGTEATTWAQAYWYYLIGAYGVGTRTVSTLWRDTEMDKNHMYGYIPKQFADQVKYLQFKNTATGETTYVDVTTKDVSNLFYNTKQGDSTSRWTLDQEGYVAWSTDKEAVGLYLNSKVTEGTYEVDFVGADKSVIMKDSTHHLFNMGERNYIAENGKYYRTAPTYFERELDAQGLPTGRVLFVVKAQFNV